MPVSTFTEILDDKTYGHQRASHMCIRVVSNLFVTACMTCCTDSDVWYRVFNYPQVSSSSLVQLCRNPKVMEAFLRKLYGTH
eukprot:1992226-Karenia_brevis.AAC.1